MKDTSAMNSRSRTSAGSKRGRESGAHAVKDQLNHQPAAPKLGLNGADMTPDSKAFSSPSSGPSMKMQKPTRSGSPVKVGVDSPGAHSVDSDITEMKHSPAINMASLATPVRKRSHDSSSPLRNTSPNDHGSDVESMNRRTSNRKKKPRQHYGIVIDHSALTNSGFQRARQLLRSPIMQPRARELKRRKSLETKPTPKFDVPDVSIKPHSSRVGAEFQACIPDVLTPAQRERHEARCEDLSVRYRIVKVEDPRGINRHTRRAKDSHGWIVSSESESPRVVLPFHPDWDVAPDLSVEHLPSPQPDTPRSKKKRSKNSKGAGSTDRTVGPAYLRMTAKDVAAACRPMAGGPGWHPPVYLHVEDGGQLDESEPAVEASCITELYRPPDPLLKTVRSRNQPFYL